MKKTLTTLLAAVFVVAGAQGQTFTLDVTDGSETFLVNTNPEPIFIYAYNLKSSSASLDRSAWNSIASQIAGPGGMDLITRFGPGIAGFGEANSFDSSICEMNHAGTYWPAGFRLSIGQAWPHADLGDLEFVFATERYGEVVALDGEIIPEPATMSLLGLGGLAVLRRRQRV